MDRRTLIVSGLVTLGASTLPGSGALAQTGSRPLPPAAPAGSAPPPPPPPLSTPPSSGYTPPPPPASAPPPAEAPPPPNSTPAYAAGPGQTTTYPEDEIVHNVSDFLGVTAESAGAAVERVFSRYGRPTAYIAGTEASGAFAIGARYGKGLLYMKGRQPMEVFWQGPSIGFDTGGNASRVFTLCYNLQNPEEIFQRFPGVEGSAYFIAGIGVNYQQAGGITLAPLRTGVGLRLGANVGYLAYTRKRNILPF
jgi:hypothetical protein